MLIAPKWLTVLRRRRHAEVSDSVCGAAARIRRAGTEKGISKAALNQRKDQENISSSVQWAKTLSDCGRSCFFIGNISECPLDNNFIKCWKREKRKSGVAGSYRSQGRENGLVWRFTSRSFCDIIKLRRVSDMLFLTAQIFWANHPEGTGYPRETVWHFPLSRLFLMLAAVAPNG